jgi:hypothetical protein
VATIQLTFIVDCHSCKAKVAAIESGRADHSYFDEDDHEPYGSRLLVGKCPRCQSLLAATQEQTGFEGYDSEDDEWSDPVRVYPNPPKAFSSRRIPRVVRDSLTEADRSLQAGANIAAAVMFGRTLEALCQHVLAPVPAPALPPSTPVTPAPGTAATAAAPANSSAAPAEAAAPPATAPTPAKAKAAKRVMLGEGIRRLKEAGIIDDRLFSWSQQLQAFRNLAAHPEDISISRQDAEDLQTFTNAIVEYVYDLADRYEEFKERVDARSHRRRS